MKTDDVDNFIKNWCQGIELTEDDKAAVKTAVTALIQGCEDRTGNKGVNMQDFTSIANDYSNLVKLDSIKTTMISGMNGLTDNKLSEDSANQLYTKLIDHFVSGKSLALEDVDQFIADNFGNLSEEDQNAIKKAVTALVTGTGKEGLNMANFTKAAVDYAAAVAANAATTSTETTTTEEATPSTDATSTDAATSTETTATVAETTATEPIWTSPTTYPKRSELKNLFNNIGGRLRVSDAPLDQRCDRFDWGITGGGSNMPNAELRELYWLYTSGNISKLPNEKLTVESFKQFLSQFNFREKTGETGNTKYQYLNNRFSNLKESVASGNIDNLVTSCKLLQMSNEQLQAICDLINACPRNNDNPFNILNNGINLE